MKIILLFFILSTTSHIIFSQSLKTDSIAIYYTTGKYELDAIKIQEIDRFLNIKHLLNIKDVYITSYTDAIGSDSANDTLSKYRAQTIADFVKTAYYYHDYHVNHLGKHPESTPLAKEQAKHRVSILKRTYEVFNKDTLNCHLDPLLLTDKGKTVVLRDVYFEWGRYKLTPKSYNEVQNLYYFLEKNPTLVIEIQGHVCCGNPKEARGEMESAHNLKLSTNRAKEVKKVLVMLGIDEKRIKTIGYGFTRPRVFPQKNSDDAQQNRRIEVKRISQ